MGVAVVVVVRHVSHLGVRKKGVPGDPRVFGFSSWKDRVVPS